MSRPGIGTFISRAWAHLGLSIRKTFSTDFFLADEYQKHLKPLNIWCMYRATSSCDFLRTHTRYDNTRIQYDTTADLSHMRYSTRARPLSPSLSLPPLALSIHDIYIGVCPWYTQAR